MSHKLRNGIIVSILPAILGVMIAFVIPISNLEFLAIYSIMYGLLYHFVLENSKIEGSRYDKKKTLEEVLIGIIIIILSLCFLIIIENMRSLLNRGCLLLAEIFFTTMIAICAVVILNNLIMMIKSFKIKHKSE